MPKFVYKGRQRKIRAGGIEFLLDVPVEVESPTQDQLLGFADHNVHKIEEKPKPTPMVEPDDDVPNVYRPAKKTLRRKSNKG